MPLDRDKERSPLSAKEDFDAAFKDFEEPAKAPSQGTGDCPMRAFDGVGAPKAAGEFPPIQEFGGKAAFPNNLTLRNAWDASTLFAHLMRDC